MDPAQIVVDNLQGDGRAVIFQLLAKPVREPRIPPLLHAHRKILPLEIASRNPTLPLAHKRSDFINLDAPARKLAHLSVHEGRTSVAYLHQEPHDRAAVRVGKALGGADGVTLDQSSS